MSLGVSNKINPLTFRNSKLKWQGDFDLFQQFVDEILNIKGEWRVPRGGCKQLKTQDVTIRWYESRSVLLDGTIKDVYIDMLQKIAAFSPDSECNLGVDDLFDVTPTHKPSLQNINNFMVNANLSNSELLNFDASQNHPSISLNDNVSTSEIDQSFKDNPMCLEANLLDNVMKRIDVLSNEFEKYKSETTIVMNELVDACEIRNDQMRVNHLAQENDSLKKENKALKSDLQKLESLLSETSSKLTYAENEKASLVAVIRLLNEDCANVVSVVGKNDRSKSGQLKNPLCTVHRRSENQIASDAVSLHNQYSCVLL